MAVTYLKKRNMCCFAKKHLGDVIPASIDCHYKKCDGMEILRFIGIDFYRYEILVNVTYARITVWDVDDDGVPFVVREEIVRDI